MHKIPRKCIETKQHRNNPNFLDFMSILHVFLEKVQQIRGTVSSTMFGGDRGEISSPNFPDRYALNDETFTYILTNLDPYGKIRIIFDDWDLASVSTLQV